MRLSLRMNGSAALGFLCSFSAAAPTTSCRAGQWLNLSSTPVPRQECGVTAIGNTTIAVLGGIVPTGPQTAETTDLFQLYDIAMDRWSTVTPAPIKVNHPNVAARDGKLYLLGGLVVGPVVAELPMNWVATQLSFVYDMETDTWSDLAPMPNGTERGSAIVGVYREMIYLAGGETTLQTAVPYAYQDALVSVIAFNTTSGAWQRLEEAAAQLPASREHATGGVIGSTFLVIGGRTYSQLDVRDTVFELNLRNLSAGWQTSPNPMPIARGGINGGAVGKKFFVFGGEGNPNTVTGIFNQSEVFNTATQKWTELKPMPVPRHGTQAASVGNRVYIPGGGLQMDGKPVLVNGSISIENPTSHFDAYCA